MSPKRVRRALSSGSGVLALAATIGLGCSSSSPLTVSFQVQVFLGDNQVAAPGEVLPEDVVVQLVPAEANRTIRWVVTSGGGDVLPQTTTDANGRASTWWRLGLLPGTQTLDARCTDCQAARFTAAAVDGKVWTGARSTDWEDPGNWSPAGVPNGGQVHVPASAPRDPVLTARAIVGSLTGDPGVSLALNDHDLVVDGSLRWLGTASSTGGRTLLSNVNISTIEGTVVNAEILGDYEAAFPVNFTGTGLSITQSGFLDLNGYQVTATGLLLSGDHARLISDQPGSSLTVGGNADFDGECLAPDQMSDGILRIEGSLLGYAGFCPTADHITVLAPNAAGAVVDGSPSFATLQLPGSVHPLTLASDIRAERITTVSLSPASLVATGDVSVVTREASLLDLTLDHVRLVIDAGTELLPVPGLTRLVFRNSPTVGAQLAIRHPGRPVAFATTDLTFESQPASGGFYLSVTDTDPANALPLIVDMNNPAPATGAPYVQTQTGAVVNWGPAAMPCPGATRTWTGSVSGQWSNPGNWVPVGVPDETDDVCIPASANPTLSAPVAVGNLTGLAGANLSHSGFDLSVHRDLDWAGSSTPGFGAVRLVGASGTIRGTVNQLQVLGDYTVAGRLTVTLGLTVEPGRLTLNGHTVSASSMVVGIINALGSGRLVMTDPLDSLLIAGVAPHVTFHGGDETGLLTAGVLRVGGNLTQLFGTTSFVASGTHRTVFPAGAHLVQLFSVQSQFQDLDVSAATTVTVNSNATVHGQLTATPSVGGPTLASSNFQLTAGGVNITGLTLSRLRLSISGGSIIALRNVSFTDFQSLSFPRLEIQHPGQAIPFVFDNLSFADQPPIGGAYISANDTAPNDGVVLTINVTNSTPASGGPFVLTANGAVVNWP